MRGLNERDVRYMAAKDNPPPNHDILQRRIDQLREAQDKIRKSCKASIENQEKFVNALAKIKEDSLRCA
jgi:hypothetical protein